MIRIVIVDGFSSGKFVARRLYEEGCLLMHVASSSALDSYYYNGFDYSFYEQMLINDNLAATIVCVARFKPDFVIAGAETGVLLADRINEQLQLPYRNAFEHSSARRNKFDMIERVTQAGLLAAQQTVASDWHSACAWITRHGKFPVVIKPLDSAGADGVHICDDLQACEGAVGKLLGVRNRLNLDNHQVLVQEYLAGVEYVVNMVSLEGEQLVTEVVKYQKQRLEEGGIVYDIDELVSPHGPAYEALVAYTREVVRSLGIRNGASHAEVMLTPEGPRLVEIAARTDGILRPHVSRQTTGLGQIDALVMSIIQPDMFRHCMQGFDYVLLQHGYNVCLINRSQGVFDKGPFLTELLKLESFFEAVFYVDDGQTIGPTQDVFSQPGTVYLVHADPEVLALDYYQIRVLEAQGVYLGKTGTQHVTKP
ncbi:MAG: Dapdiamide A synthase [Pseudomonas sp.]|nr:MAG: Dapdiamide A synthase [Pseudomonas sp.]